MDLAEAWLEEGGETDGVILTTDAGSQVAPNWIAENLAAFQDGARRSSDKSILMAKASSYQRLHWRGALEDAYERLLTELSWLLDPLEHNPWPHHATISGASLGGDSYGLLPRWAAARVPLGEDKALIALLSRQDARIRSYPTAHVITSGRTDGRAPVGVADILRSGAESRTLSVTPPWSPSHTHSPASWRGVATPA
jgi:hypothetical protein